MIWDKCCTAVLCQILTFMSGLLGRPIVKGIYWVYYFFLLCIKRISNTLFLYLHILFKSMYLFCLWNAIQNSFQDYVTVIIFRNLLKHQAVLLPYHKYMEVSWFLYVLLSASVTTWCFKASFTSCITLLLLTTWYQVQAFTCCDGAAEHEN